MCEECGVCQLDSSRDPLCAQLDAQRCDPGEDWRGLSQEKSTWHSQETHAGIAEGLCLRWSRNRFLKPEPENTEADQRFRVRTLEWGGGVKGKREVVPGLKASSHLCTSNPSQAQTGVCHKESRGVLVERMAPSPQSQVNQC